MDLGLKGKNALVLASSRGLGFGIAKNLAREGCNVAICSKNADNLARARKILEDQFPVKIISCEVDLESEKEVSNLIEWVMSEFNELNILVTNAGGPPTKPLMTISTGEWEKAISGILKPVINCFNKVIPHMISLGGGRIITLTSITVKSPFVNFALSNTLRAGIAGLVKTAANEHASDNVLINNVCPGYTGTERVEDIVMDIAAREDIPSESALQRITSGIPLKRLATVDEIADTVVFFASDRASYITGQSIAVDGGYAQGLL